MIKSFEQTLKFPLDRFQKEAIEKIDKNTNVLVCAPTGSGKTVVANFAIYKSIAEDTKVFYTTPIKALSNQKYRELVQELGEEKVGLLTGDICINAQAQIVVMTTEVLRNMIYEKSDSLDNLAFVVLDEIHYLADEFRGPIWEEIIIHLDFKVCIIGLSATISNSKQFADWIGQCRYHCELIETSYRPVPLYQKMLVGDEIYDLFSGKKHVSLDSKKSNKTFELQDDLFANSDFKINDSLLKAIQKVPADHSARRFRTQVLPRHKIISLLDDKKMLPAIFFIFSRANCDQAMYSCLDKKIDLTTDEEKIQIQEHFQNFYNNIEKTDHKNLNLHKWAKCLINGYATHHAGLLPVMKELVEKLFSDGLIKVVFATGTLALGVNMPAKTVVLESLYTWNGKSHVMLSPIEFTQLAGRAGRRGIDTLGNVIVIYDGSCDPEDYFDLATSKNYELNSVFKPTYNMVASLLKNFEAKDVEELLRCSFAQFQGNEVISQYASRIRKEQKISESYYKNLVCSKGNYFEYANLKEKYYNLQSKYKYEKFLKQKQYNEIFLEQYCRVGSIFTYKKGRHRKYGVVISPLSGKRNLFFTVISEKGNRKKIYLDSLEEIYCAYVTKIDKTKLKEDEKCLFYEAFYNVKSAKKLSLILKHIIRNKKDLHYIYPEKAKFKDCEKLVALEKRIFKHNCNSCEDKKEHLLSYRKYKEHADNIKKYESLIEKESGNISKLFANTIKVLFTLGYLDENNKLTDKGIMLSKIHSENDLLIAQAIDLGLFDNLSADIMTCLLSACIYSGRKNSSKRLPKKYVKQFRGLDKKLFDLYKKIDRLQRNNKLDEIHDLDFGLVEALFPWCNGAALSDVLINSEMEAGDFVRWCKQVKDLLIQVENAGLPNVSLQCVVARNAINRSVVSWSSV